MIVSQNPSHFLLGLLGLTALLVSAGLMTGCDCGDADAGADSALSDVPAPIPNCDDAYACAECQGLEDLPPEEYDNLHNVYRLSEAFICGGEPLTPTALKKVAAMGIKTILSVDGKVPDAETAKTLGMRYVHVPIRYGGLSQGQVAKIAKTFRELEPPFYVHCFHGKHRGPAAAAIGRILIDGVSRETAIAEMRRCGTAAKYSGLYESIATGALPTTAATEALDFGFDTAHPFKGVRAGMIRLTRSFDQLKAAAKRDFAADPNHPDISARNEAAKILQHFERMNTTDELEGRPADYREWMTASVAATRGLHESLVGIEAGTDGADAQADGHLTAMKTLCSKCHTPYRNR